MNIRFVTHDQVPHLPEQLAELSNIAFAEYEGGRCPGRAVAGPA